MSSVMVKKVQQTLVVRRGDPNCLRVVVKALPGDAGAKGDRGAAGSKGDKGEPGRDGLDFDPTMIANLADRIGSLETQPLFRGVLGQQVALDQFATVPIAMLTDTHGAWDATASHYVIPRTGNYLCSGKVRIAESFAPRTSYGLNIETANIDSNGMFWTETQPTRNGHLNMAIRRFVAGEQVRLVLYCDAAPTPIIAAEFSVVMLSG